MTPTTRWNLAQVNIALARAAIDDPVMADFKAALDEVNSLAERSPGFVWRLKDDAGNATAIRAFPDPRMLVNLSVWTDVVSLQNYVYRSLHGRFFARRQEWFEKSDRPHLALWWIPAGTQPSVEEARARLEQMERLGPTAEAFTFRQLFPAPNVAAIAGESR